MRRVTKVFKTLASAVMVSGAALALVLPSAAALPPGGAGDSTEGTSSTVTGSVEAGGTLSFSLRQFSKRHRRGASAKNWCQRLSFWLVCAAQLC